MLVNKNTFKFERQDVECGSACESVSSAIMSYLPEMATVLAHWHKRTSLDFAPFANFMFAPTSRSTFSQLSALNLVT